MFYNDELIFLYHQKDILNFFVFKMA